jgi:hypothetical protein
VANVKSIGDWLICEPQFSQVDNENETLGLQGSKGLRMAERC